jgi:hypothetical protein
MESGIEFVGLPPAGGEHVVEVIERLGRRVEG